MSRWRSWAGLLAAVVIGALMTYAGAVKLGDPQSFADSIASFQMVPRLLIVPMALALPVFEIGLGLLMALRRPRRVGALGVILMLAAYLIAIGSAQLRGVAVHCGCFGSATTVNPRWELLQDLLLLAGAVFVYFSSPRPASGQPASD